MGPCGWSNSRRTRFRSWLLDALLAVEELAGFALSNRPAERRASADGTRSTWSWSPIVSPGRGDPLGRARGGCRAGARRGRRPGPEVPDLDAARQLERSLPRGRGEPWRLSRGSCWRLATRGPPPPGTCQDRARSRFGPSIWRPGPAGPAAVRQGEPRRARPRPGGHRRLAATARRLRLARLAGRQPRQPMEFGSQRTSMRVDVVDRPSRRPTTMLCAVRWALAGRGADVGLITSAFAYGEAPKHRAGLRRARVLLPPGPRTGGYGGRACGRSRSCSEHGPDMARYRVRRPRSADIVHFQWLAVWLRRRRLLLCPAARSCSRPTTCCRVSPQSGPGGRPAPGAVRGGRRRFDRTRVRPRISSSRPGPGVAAEKVTVVHHGAFDYLARLAPSELPPELTAATPARSRRATATAGRSVPVLRPAASLQGL